MSGSVKVGTQALVGATVSVYATGTAASQLGTSTTTNSSGGFSVTFTCPSPTTLIYVTANGGHIGTGAANAHIQLASALGECGTLPASIIVNELTSVAAAYALGEFAPPAGTAAVTFQGKSPGLSQAFISLSDLIVPGTGTFATSTPVTNQTAVQEELDTLADAMVACDVSSAAGACAELFSCASVNGTFAATGQPCTGGSTSTTDTLSAALAVTQNAGLVSMAGVFDVATTIATPFSPVLGAVPNDWTLPLIFAVANFGPLAVDAAGHVWMLAADPHPANPPPATPNLAVVEIDADGTLISPSLHGWTAGGVSSIQGNDVTNLAIDTSGNVWVKGTASTIAELTSSGAGAAGAPFSSGPGSNDTAGVAIDFSGNAWFSSGNTAAVFEVSTAGTNLSGAAGYSAANCPCNGIAADRSGNVWVVASGASQALAQLSANGTEGNTFNPDPVNYPLATMYNIATDGAANLWITDSHYHVVWEFTPSGTPIGSTGTFGGPFSNTAAPGTLPKGLAIDGAGHKWVANAGNPGPSSLTELSADGAVNLSPSNGFAWGVVDNAYSVAVDESGNVWVADGANYVAEIVGAAAPTKNPIATAVSSGSFTP